MPQRFAVKGKCLLSPLVPACAQVLADAVLLAREELFAGCEISAWIKCQKASPWLMGRAHLTSDSSELRSPLGGSVGSGPEQSTGCHEHDLPAPAVTGWAGVRFMLRRGGGRDRRPRDLEA